MEKRFGWHPAAPRKPGEKFRAALEAIAYLIALGVRQHEQAGQVIGRVSVSGGIARSRLMCEILASVIKQPLHLLQSEEGPALGAAVTALAGLETHAAAQEPRCGAVHRGRRRGPDGQVPRRRRAERGVDVDLRKRAEAVFRADEEQEVGWVECTHEVPPSL